jgi:Arc/MetJ-type ribon-helix-helix transcriptional regulator
MNRDLIHSHFIGVLPMTIQIAVKLPDDLVGQIDRLVERGAFDSRSQAVRTGLEAIVADRRRQELDETATERPSHDGPRPRQRRTTRRAWPSTRSTRSSGSPGGSTEVALSADEGLPVESVASFDNLRPFSKAMLVRRLGTLGPRRHEICRAPGATLDY